MCILSETEHLSVIGYLLILCHNYFVRMTTFETHGHFIYVKGYTKHPNECKYKVH